MKDAKVLSECCFVKEEIQCWSSIDYDSAVNIIC